VLGSAPGLEGRAAVLDRVYGSLLGFIPQVSPGFRYAAPRANFCGPYRDSFHAITTELTNENDSVPICFNLKTFAFARFRSCKKSDTFRVFHVH